MFNFKKNGLLPPRDDRPEREPEPKKPMSAEVKRRLWTTIGLSVALIVIWYGANAVAETLEQPIIGLVTLIVYGVAFAAVLIAYIIYNRAFLHKNITVEELPDDWPLEKKEAFVEDNRRRTEKSRWMVTLIIPFATVFLVESIVLFFGDTIMKFLGL